MKMIFPFYANNIENRRKYNLAVSNSASCLANELYKRQVSKPGVKHFIFVAGSYGAGKSFFIQSLYEKNKSELEDCIVYEGSITTKSIDGKIKEGKDGRIKLFNCSGATPSKDGCCPCKCKQHRSGRWSGRQW